MDTAIPPSLESLILESPEIINIHRSVAFFNIDLMFDRKIYMKYFDLIQHKIKLNIENIHKALTYWYINT
jgi:hypothetical protein